MELLALVESPDHVCCRYRIKAFEPFLSRFGIRLTYESIESNPAKRLAQMLRTSQYDSVILQRKLLDGLSFQALRAASKNLIFDFDDAVLYRDSYSSKGLHCVKRLRRFERIVSQVDTVLAGNSFLANRAENFGAKASNVHFMPTCIDLAAYDYARTRTQLRQDDRFVMVWIGSSSTLKGLEATQKLWEAIGELIPNALLRVVCDRFPDFRKLNSEKVQWTQGNEISQIVSADIGISHVPDDLWSRGKCGLKVLQYLAGGLPVLTNPVGVHQEMVKSGTNGFLVDKPREWLEAIHWLSKNRDSRAKMGLSATETIRNGYDVADWGLHFVDRVMPGAVAPISMEEIQANLHLQTSSKPGREWMIDREMHKHSQTNGHHCEIKAGRGVNS
jgi:glycosyltransferase involved in cell wall biosynthesis